MKISSFSHGADTLSIRIASHESDNYEEWYKALDESIYGLEKENEFSQIVPRKGDFVNSGFPCLFKGKSFEFWSDDPGIIIIHSGPLRSRHGEELVSALSTAWNSSDPL